MKPLIIIDCTWSVDQQFTNGYVPIGQLRLAPSLVIIGEVWLNASDLEFEFFRDDGICQDSGKDLAKLLDRLMTYVDDNGGVDVMNITAQKYTAVRNWHGSLVAAWILFLLIATASEAGLLITVLGIVDWWFSW